MSSAGGGTDCTRSSPCGDFTTAQTATLAGGVISVIDSGDYNGLTITKSLTIRAEGAEGSATIVNGGGYFTTIVAGANDVVTLEGLHFNGGGIFSSPEGICTSSDASSPID